MPSLSFAVFRSAGFRFGSPLLISILMILALEGLTAVLASYQDLLLTLPYILFSLVVLLSQPFNQGRTGLVALLMMVAYYIIQTYLQEPLSNDSTKLIYTLLASLLPLNLLQIHIMPDKRLWSRFGIYFMLFIALQIAWSALVVDHFSQTTLSWLWDTYLYTIPTLSPLPIILILLAFALTCSSAATILKRNFGSDQTVYISLLFSSLAFVLFQYAFISSTAFSLAATLLLLNIITCSHELAFVDQLTNIPGRRALETELKNLGRTYTLAMLDIDHFKQFNDNHGHKVGDNVLKLVAKIMQQTKGGAQIFRYGGEEFTILFKGKEASQCQDYLEQLRIAIAKYDLIIRGQDDRPQSDEKGTELRQEDKKSQSVHVTVSIGLADSFPDHNPQNVLKAADEALYKAKKSGRNRVAR
ncbi:GGDEF domain-containing protein [Photobacterium lipolyticum]|uniref:diguanylate cyclase n=2 Tax=Photobacterium lipolyticum TaxID=266810 RepID=A0A2T3MZ30_9GAMM|nr:GGDEF domain-containing protein [Photobacterium lipolyticum]PSW05208.1 GGDEF domain-containing protein [Photobacterium lipolyticum]